MNGVAMKRRKFVLQSFYFKIGNRCTAYIGHAHAKHQRIDQVANDNVATLHTLLGKPIIRMQRMMIHRDHAKQMIVCFRDGLARPVSIYIADNEIF